MFILDPLYHNEVGSAFTLRKNQEREEINSKIQLVIGDIAILMELIEIRTLLSVIRSLKNDCKCDKHDTKDVSCKTIKCSTPAIDITIKATPIKLLQYEELILGILFQLEYTNLLTTNDIM